MNLHLALCLLLSLGLACAAAEAPGADAPLAGTRWELVELAGEPLEEDGAPAPHVALDAATRRLTGHGGVNSFGAGYELADGSVRLGPITSTRMAGPPAAMGRESTLLVALERADEWRVRGRTLALVERGATLARFEARAGR